MGVSRQILIMFPHLLTDGGAATATLQFASMLRRNGHSVSILCAKASDSFIGDYKELDIQELKIPISSSPLYWALLPFWQYRIHKTVAQYRDPILFPQVLPSNWWAWIYKKFNRDTKVIWYCHEPSAFFHSKNWIDAIPSYPMKVMAKLMRPITRALDIWLEKSSDVVVCNSLYTSSQYEKTYGRRAFNIAYPPFRDNDDVPNDGDKEKIVFTIGRLTKFKRVDTLIRAFEKFHESNPLFRLVIAGVGEYKSKLEELAKNSSASDNIAFLGRISEENKSALLRRALVTVVAAHDEPYGIVPLESMDAGTPVIAHNSGGPRETIVPNNTGYLYSTDSELVEYLEQIAHMDDSQYRIMQRACQSRVKNFNLDEAEVHLLAALLKLHA